jgi:hypothetical protein
MMSDEQIKELALSLSHEQVEELRQLVSEADKLNIDVTPDVLADSRRIVRFRDDINDAIGTFLSRLASDDG